MLYIPFTYIIFYIHPTRTQHWNDCWTKYKNVLPSSNLFIDSRYCIKPFFISRYCKSLNDWGYMHNWITSSLNISAHKLIWNPLKVPFFDVFAIADPSQYHFSCALILTIIQFDIYIHSLGLRFMFVLYILCRLIQLLIVCIKVYYGKTNNHIKLKGFKGQAMLSLYSLGRHL